MPRAAGRPDRCGISVKPGTAAVTITGKGSFTGTVTLNFTGTKKK